MTLVSIDQRFGFGYRPESHSTGVAKRAVIRFQFQMAAMGLHATDTPILSNNQE